MTESGAKGRFCLVCRGLSWLLLMVRSCTVRALAVARLSYIAPGFGSGLSAHVDALCQAENTQNTAIATRIPPVVKNSCALCFRSPRGDTAAGAILGQNPPAARLIIVRIHHVCFGRSIPGGGQWKQQWTAASLERKKCGPTGRPTLCHWSSRDKQHWQDPRKSLSWPRRALVAPLPLPGAHLTPPPFSPLVAPTYPFVHTYWSWEAVSLSSLLLLLTCLDVCSWSTVFTYIVT